jgi:hypothetical protein
MGELYVSKGQSVRESLLNAYDHGRVLTLPELIVRRAELPTDSRIWRTECSGLSFLLQDRRDLAVLHGVNLFDIYGLISDQPQPGTFNRFDLRPGLLAELLRTQSIEGKPLPVYTTTEEPRSRLIAHLQYIDQPDRVVEGKHSIEEHKENPLLAAVFGAEQNVRFLDTLGTQTYTVAVSCAERRTHTPSACLLRVDNASAHGSLRDTYTHVAFVSEPKIKSVCRVPRQLQRGKQ